MEAGICSGLVLVAVAQNRGTIVVNRWKCVEFLEFLMLRASIDTKVIGDMDMLAEFVRYALTS